MTTAALSLWACHFCGLVIFGQGASVSWSSDTTTFPSRTPHPTIHETLPAIQVDHSAVALPKAEGTLDDCRRKQEEVIKPLQGMEVAVQVFGGVGLIETMVELAYVISSRDNFNPFEALFFSTTVAFEIAAELLFFCVGICWLRRHSNLRTSVKTLAKDPVHHVAAVATDATEDTSREFSVLSLAAIAVSLLPLLAWATFLPVWAPSLGGSGEDVRMALAVCSLVGLLAFAFAGSRARLAASGFERQMAMDFLVAIGFVLYATQKIFEVYVLMASVDRLCPGVLGKALVAFLSVEVVSVFLVVAALCSVVHDQPW